MLKKSLFIVLTLFFTANFSMAVAEPTIAEVYRAMDAGHAAEAQGMMAEGPRDHPNSAKAHFVESQILLKEGHVTNARTELATAERLAPGLPFANTYAVQELKDHLGHASGLSPIAGITSLAAPAPRFPWGLLLLAIAVIAVIAMMIRSRRNYGGPAYGPSTYSPSGAPVYGPGAGNAGMMGPAGGMGSGILGGLATGAAVGAGMVGGEALMDHMLHRNDGEQIATSNADTLDAPQPDYDMGGNDFGVSDTSSWDSGGGGGDDWS